MKLFGFRINAGEIKDVREIEKTLENNEEKKKLTVKQLLDKFEEASGEEFSNDSAILG